MKAPLLEVMSHVFQVSFELKIVPYSIKSLFNQGKIVGKRYQFEDSDFNNL